eukprot:scaffold56641_cov49-Attheya_sp.AAC.2
MRSLATSSDPSPSVRTRGIVMTTRSDHVRNNKWERVSVAVGDIGCRWLVVVAEPWGVVIGVEGVMVGLLLLLIIVCVLGVVGTGQK